MLFHCRSLSSLAALAAFAAFPYPSFAASAKPHAAKPAAAPVKKVLPVLVAQVVAPVTPPAPAPVPVDQTAPAADGYTGLIIDARYLPGILRSPAPAIYGPAPDTTLLYPDRSHVPTADEVQDESIVRYYHTEDEARAGVGGPRPLVVKAEAVLGYAHDALQLSAADMARLQDLEKNIHFTRSWKVGFLLPAGQ